jgi:hypothetical protein
MTTSEQRTRRPVRLQPGQSAQPDVAPAPTRRHRVAEQPTPPTPPVSIISTDHLPPFGLILARPLLLLVAGLVGALCGFAFTGQAGYKAEALLQFTAPSADSMVVKQTGQTLARRVQSADVVAAAESASGAPAGSLTAQIDAGWEQDTNLVLVSVEADTEEAAIAAANALAAAVVQTSEAEIRSQLEQAYADSTELLDSDGLPSQAAEDARQAQVGQSLANRQDAIAARSGAVMLIDPASTARQAGITPALGTLIGLVAGLLLGGLAAIVLGVRGLRVSSARSLRTLFPAYRIETVDQAAKLVGEVLETGRDCVAVVCPAGTRDAAIRLADDVVEFAGAHGRSVHNLGLVTDRSMALATLGRETRRDLMASMDVDMLVVVVESGTHAAHMLEGQTDVAAVVMVRRRRTGVAEAALAMNAFDRAMPTMVLAG